MDLAVGKWVDHISPSASHLLGFLQTDPNLGLSLSLLAGSCNFSSDQYKMGGWSLLYSISVYRRFVYLSDGTFPHGICL